MILTVEMPGLEGITLGFGQAGAEFEAGARRILKDYAGHVVSMAGQLAPKGETGFLSRSVRSDEFADGLGFEAGWFWQDYKAAGLDPYYWWTEFGTSDTDAQPTLGPVWEDLAPNLYRDLSTLFDRTFR